MFFIIFQYFSQTGRTAAHQSKHHHSVDLPHYLPRPRANAILLGTNELGHQHSHHAQRRSLLLPVRQVEKQASRVQEDVEERRAVLPNSVLISIHRRGSSLESHLKRNNGWSRLAASRKKSLKIVAIKVIQRVQVSTANLQILIAF
jgi:hypothetical protein